MFEGATEWVHRFLYRHPDQKVDELPSGRLTNARFLRSFIECAMSGETIDPLTQKNVAFMLARVMAGELWEVAIPLPYRDLPEEWKGDGRIAWRNQIHAWC